VAEEVKNPTHIGMSYFFSQMNFAAEPVDSIWVAQEFRANAFQRHMLAQFHILGLVHFSHTAPGDESCDPKTVCQQVA
jgi:hypothetical protein